MSGNHHLDHEAEFTEEEFVEHPALTVEQLQQAWRLGNLLQSWAEQPGQMNDAMIAELVTLGDAFGVNTTQALFAFQQAYQNDIEQMVHPLQAAFQLFGGMQPPVGHVAKLGPKVRRSGVTSGILDLEEVVVPTPKLNDLMNRPNPFKESPFAGAERPAEVTSQIEPVREEPEPGSVAEVALVNWATANLASEELQEFQETGQIPSERLLEFNEWLNNHELTPLDPELAAMRERLRHQISEAAAADVAHTLFTHQPDYSGGQDSQRFSVPPELIERKPE